MAGVVAGFVFGGTVVVVVDVVGVVAAGAVTGAAVTVVLTVLVGHVVTVATWGMSVVTTGVPQLGPLHEAVLVMVPVASEALAVTE